MSLKGQILRGEKWYLMNRDADGNLTAGIKKDVNKMKEITLYLEARDPEPVEAPKEIKPKKVK